MKPIVWTIAGSDTSSGAGIQSDLMTFHDFDVHGCNVITTLTAQNTQSIEAVEPVNSKFLIKQIFALSKIQKPLAIKISVLNSKENIEAMSGFLKNNKAFVIYDPVFISSSGTHLVESIDSVKTLLKYIDLLTPNRQEVELLLNQSIKTKSDIENAAKNLLKFGVKNVLLKGGHWCEPFSSDFFCNEEISFWLNASPIKTKDTHGTGCALSAAITAAIALGYDLKDALVIGKMYVSQGIRLGYSFNSGMNFFNHCGFPSKQIDLPFISNKIENIAFKFKDCGKSNLGFYPIVDSYEWVKQLIACGVSTIQLRIKDKSHNVVEGEIKKSVMLAKESNCQLFINDYWEFAIKHQAYGVHLGQDDIDTAKIDDIYKAGLRLGISTHSFYEIASAHAYKPSYIAYGPVYHTTSKSMAFTPRGLDKLRYWSDLLDYPLVAIGGINVMNLDDILKTGVKIVAVISAVTKASNPEAVVGIFLEKLGVKV